MLRAKIWYALVRLQFMVLIGSTTFLSLTPNPGDVFESVWDKFLHTFAWFVLLLSLYLAWQKIKLPWWPPLVLLAYSGLIEVIQGLIPERQFGLGDLLANAIGIASAYFLTLLLAPLYSRLLLNPLRKLFGLSAAENGSEK